MKIFFIIYCTIFLGDVSFSQNYPLNDRIYWSDTVKIKWLDFQGVPDSLDKHRALSTTSLSYNVELVGRILEINIEPVFLKSKSWVRCDTTASLLLHEQKHFDIVEIFARKIRKKLLSEEFTLANYQGEFSTIYNNLYKEMRHYQKLYDLETDHSRISEKQKEWNKKISEELEKYNDYKESVIEVYLTD